MTARTVRTHSILISVLLLLARGTVLMAQTTSSAQKFAPADLDPHGSYRKVSADEVYDAYSEAAGVNNDFVGMQVKVFGKYANFSEIPLRPLRVGSGGCHDEICDHMDFLTYLRAAKPLDHPFNLNPLLVTLYFDDDSVHSKLIEASKKGLYAGKWKSGHFTPLSEKRRIGSW